MAFGKGYLYQDFLPLFMKHWTYNPKQSSQETSRVKNCSQNSEILVVLKVHQHKIVVLTVTSVVYTQN